MACQPSPEPPPVNGGKRQRSTVVNDGQPWRTTSQPPPDHRSTAVDRQSTVRSNGGHRCHVAAKWYHVETRGTTWQLTWLLTWRGRGNHPLCDSNIENLRSGFIITKGSNRDKKGLK
ncbi:hypothetical protein Tco_0452100 [Tanacetum coccineum]